MREQVEIELPSVQQYSSLLIQLNAIFLIFDFFIFYPKNRIKRFYPKISIIFYCNLI